MSELENPTFLKMLQKTDPISLLAAGACIFLFAYLYRNQIYNVFETYVAGRFFKKQKEEEKDETENPNREVLTLLLSLENEVKQLKGTQQEMIESQSHLSMELSNIKSELSVAHEKMNRISESQDFLMISDKEDKKAFITREFNYFCGKIHKIDLYSRETIEKIYELYLKEGGDTFVQGMMTAIRALPTIGQPSTPSMNFEIYTEDSGKKTE